jgi:uncharacterized delta-60 repeat protein
MTSGIVTTDLGGSDLGQAVAIQPDGKILVAGSTDLWGSPGLALIRYNADGTLDTTFTDPGPTRYFGDTQGSARSVFVQSDGKIVIAGSVAGSTSGTTEICVERFNADGTPDLAFAGVGRTTPVVSPSSIVGVGLAEQGDGKILVTGGLGWNVLRLNTDGSVDTTFKAAAPSFPAFAIAESVAVQPDGKIVVAGYGNYGLFLTDFMLVRYNADGSLDTAFDGLPGFLVKDFGNSTDAGLSVLLQGDGKIVVSGYSDSTGAGDFALLRYNSDGSLDTTFNGTGAVTTDFFQGVDVGASVALQSDGKLIVSGYCTEFGQTEFAIARYNSDGSLDTTFNGTGKVTTAFGSDNAQAASLALQSDGSIVVAGFVAGTTDDFAVVRYKADGTVDTSFGIPAAPTGMTLIGTAGADTLLGGAGNDSLTGGSGSDSMDGGDGSDLYIINAATDHPAAEIHDSGTTGTDEVRFAGTTASTLTLLAGDTGIERVVMGTGTGASADTSASTALNVNASAVGNALTLIGNSGANKLTGTAFNDTIDGGGGVDTMIGGAGNDTYVLDNTADVITEVSGGGIDTAMASVSYTLGGNVENLVLASNAAIIGIGNALANTITGNSADNVIDGKAGVDHLDGGDGSDIYMIDVATDHPAAEIADSGAGGIDEVRFAATKTSTLTLFAGDSGIERVVIGTGTAATAVTTGTAALNVNASAAPNGLAIYGNAGKNTLIGTAFDDTIAGGSGNDTLTGGGGGDTFAFAAAPNASSNKDTITDFTPGVDLLQFSLAIYSAAGSAPGALDPSEFWSSPTAVAGHAASDRFIYNTTTGVLYYDSDGNGPGAAVAIALLGTSTHPALTAADIILSP